MNAHKNTVPPRTAPRDDPLVEAGLELKTLMEDALTRRQMSVSALSREAKVQRGDIYRWWRGDQRPTRNSLARIAQALQVDARELTAPYGDMAPRPATANAILEAIARQSALIEGLTARLDRLLEDDPVESGVREGLRRAQAHQAEPVPGTPAPSQPRRPRDTGAARGRPADQRPGQS